MPKQVYFFAALFWTGIILFFCLIRASQLPVIKIPNLDKCVHALLHFVFTTLWFLFFKKQLYKINFKKTLLISFLLSVLFGIVVEIAQEFFTTTRRADVFDVLSNVTGATLAVLLILWGNRNGVFDKI